MFSNRHRFVRAELQFLGYNTQQDPLPSPKNSLETEEGLAVYYDRETAALHGQTYDDLRTWIGTFAIGLASGVITPPQTFLSLFTFFESFYLLRRLLKGLDRDIQTSQEKAKQAALTICLRTYRGVPDLDRTGICYTKDVLYLRGLWKIERALAQDETVLDRLAVGVVALEQLPDLRELGIVTSPQPFTKLAIDPELDTYILSFEHPEEHVSQLEYAFPDWKDHITWLSSTVGLSSLCKRSSGS